MGIYRARYRGKRDGYWRRTWKNKVCALALLAIGTVPVIIDQDATALVLMACFTVPMFFSRENWIA